MLAARRLGLLVVLSIVFATTSSAKAWTRTMVEGADAIVEVNRDASMDVLLTLRVQVHAGWLHELELATLGDDVVLDPSHPPYFRAEDGEVYRPDAVLSEDGRIRLTFERRGAPRKGEYKVIFRYRTRGTTTTAAGAKEARLSWSLPAWETGLHDVTVDVRAPKGSRVPDNLRDSSPGVRFSTTERPRATQLEWRRIHLPRHTPWRLAFDVPADALDLPADRPATKDATGFTPLPAEEQRPAPWALGVLALLILIKRRAIEITMGADALLVRVPWPAVVIVGAAVVITASLTGPYDVFGAIALLALVFHRRPSKLVIPPESRWRPDAPTDQRRSETPLSDLIDGTRPIGAGLAVLTIGTMVALGQPSIALVAIPIFVTGTRWHRGPGLNEASHHLRRFVEALRTPESGAPMALCWETHEISAPRCRLILPNERAGLLSLSFVTTTRYVGGVARRSVELLIQTRAQSDADDLVRRRIGAEPTFRTEDGRIGRLLPWSADAIALTRALAHRAPTIETRGSRSGTWLIEELADRPSRAA
ncbi:MAG: hypothetical protein WBG86_20700 [Polyangiales bacterium]